MNSYIVLFMTVLQLVLSSPLVPPGAEDPGKEFAVPYHTTHGYIISKLKNLYNYVFNKEDSVHMDGYTKVYVMGKHMYYTYTHEYTPSDGLHPDGHGNRVTDDPMIKQYMKSEDVAKQREELQRHIAEKKKIEEESQKRMWEHTKDAPFVRGTLPNETTTQPPESIVKSVMRQIPILKRFVRSAHSGEFAQDPMRELRHYLKDKLKSAAKRVMGRSNSKISDNLQNEMKIMAGKMGDKLLKTRDNIHEDLGNLKGKLKEGVKNVLVGAANKVGEAILPENVPWKEIRKKVGVKTKALCRKLPFIKEFIFESREEGVKVHF